MTDTPSFFYKKRGAFSGKGLFPHNPMDGNGMKKHLLRLAPLLVVGVIASVATLPAWAQDQQAYDSSSEDGGSMAIDLLLVRPFGIIASAVGAAGFVFSLPFTLPTGTTGDTAYEWVGRPLEYTFNRPLGDFDHCGHDRHPCGQR